jgi:hypothetical protein
VTRRSGVGRDGKQGWSRRAEAGWERAFRRHRRVDVLPVDREPFFPLAPDDLAALARSGFLQEGEHVHHIASDRHFVVRNRQLEEISDALPPS